MKKLTLMGLMTALLATGAARATLTYNSGSISANTAIPAGNPVGVAFTEIVSSSGGNAVPAGLTVLNVTVGLNLTGGYNGGLFAYLVAPNGSEVTLMNQPGVSAGSPFGASGAGMNITLQDGTVSNGNIQNETSSSVLSGTYNAAGSLSGFNGAGADGTWTLFFADLGSGSGAPELNSWTLGFTAVPEPANAALAVLLGWLALHWALGKCWGRPAGLGRCRRQSKISKVNPGRCIKSAILLSNSTKTTLG